MMDDGWWMMDDDVHDDDKEDEEDDDNDEEDEEQARLILTSQLGRVHSEIYILRFPDLQVGLYAAMSVALVLYM